MGTKCQKIILQLCVAGLLMTSSAYGQAPMAVGPSTSTEDSVDLQARTRLAVPGEAKVEDVPAKSLQADYPTDLPLSLTEYQVMAQSVDPGSLSQQLGGWGFCDPDEYPDYCDPGCGCITFNDRPLCYCF